MRKRTTQIAETLRRRLLRALHAGTIEPGDRLPSARDLVTDFEGADQRAVLAAYRELVEDGLVEMRARGGVYVSAALLDGVRALPPERWLVESLVEGIGRDVPIVDLHEWLRRSVETMRLRALVAELAPREALCRELRDDYGLDVVGVDPGDVAPGSAELRRSDLVVTTTAHGGPVTESARQAGIPSLVVELQPDVLAGEWRLLLRQPLWIVVGEPARANGLRQFFDEQPGGENARLVVAGSAEMRAIPPGAPVYLTRDGRAALGDAPITGRILPARRLLSGDSARALVTLIVRANIGALAATRGR